MDDAKRTFTTFDKVSPKVHVGDEKLTRTLFISIAVKRSPQVHEVYSFVEIFGNAQWDIVSGYERRLPEFYAR